MLVERLNNEIKEAMVSKDTEKRDVLRAVKSSASLMAKEKKVETMTDDMVEAAVKKEIKQLNQTLASLKDKEDSDLYKNTKYRVEVLEQYMPKMMTEAEVEEEVKRILYEQDLEDEAFGIKMKAVMNELKGKADGKVIQSVLKRQG